MSTATDLLNTLLDSRETEAEKTASLAIRAFAWARVSTDMQEERGLSLPEQLREMRSYAERNSITIVAEYSEAASAFQRDEKRIEFHRMLADLKGRKDINAIIVHDYSRFSRDSIRGKALARQLKQSGIEVISLNDPTFDTETAAGVWMEAVTFAKNEAYSREIAFHTKKGCRSNVQTRDQETGWCYKNGGQPLFGYKAVQLERGEEKKGRPIIKSIWMPDDTIINGKAAHEWARECLLMAMNGASLDELRNFCNANGIPARRKTFWSNNTWYYLLRPATLMKYCGFDIWNVHRKNGSERPPEEWTIVENAHQGIITAEEAERIATIRRVSTAKFDRQNPHKNTSPYMLGGGLFKCRQCGSNMIGYYGGRGIYYRCGTHEYRKGLGCTQCTYIQRDWIERRVVEEVRQHLQRLADPQGTIKHLNAVLVDLWTTTTDYDPEAEKEVAEIDQKIARIRQAIVSGLDDIQWANGEIVLLKAQRDALTQKIELAGDPPQLSSKRAAAAAERLAQAETDGMLAVKKVLRGLIDEITLDPEALTISMQYIFPGPLTKTDPGSGMESKVCRGTYGSGGRI